MVVDIGEDFIGSVSFRQNSSRPPTPIYRISVLIKISFCVIINQSALVTLMPGMRTITIVKITKLLYKTIPLNFLALKLDKMNSAVL